MPTILARLPERARATLSIAALSAALTLIIWAGGLFMSVRLRATDVYFVTSSAAEQTVSSDRIALIALDDASFQAYGRSLTDWDRAIYADLIDRLAQSGARVIGFDLIFSETSQSDTAFADALTRIRQSDARTRIILPIAGVGMPLPAQRTLGSVLSPTQRSLADAIRFSNRLAPIAVLAERADYLAYVNTVIDVDGVVRRQPSIIQSDDTVRYGFSLATYLAYLRIPEAAASQIVALETDGLRVAENLLIPKDELGLWRQNFFGLPNESFATYSLVEVIDGTVDPSAFTDKIVLVGLMNSQGIADSYNIPLADNGDFMAGVEILAHAVTTLLEGGVPSEQPPLSVALMLIGISALASVLFIRQGWLGKVITLIAMLVAIFVIGSIDFSVRRELISLFDAVLAVLIPVGLAFGYEIRSERRSRLRAESRFESAEGQRRLISAIFQRSPLPIALVDGQFRIYRINAAFTRIFESLSAAQDSAAPPANTWLIGLFAAAGMTAAEQTSAQNAIQSASVDPLKVAFGGKTFILGAAAIDESDYRVVTLSDVTDLDELSTLKTRLIRIAAHDVRNPLSSIIGFTDLILFSSDSLPKRINEMLARIKVSANTINSILTNLLKLEQLRSATMPLEPVSVSLLAHEVASALAPDMERRRHDFIIDIPDHDLLMTNGEPVQLGQAFSNLLGNAAKYTPDGGRIRFVISHGTPQKILIRVIDNGYGIAKDAQKELFTEFYRVRAEAVSKIEGTGLGLSLVRTIVEAHRGRVWVDSDEGKGSTFSIELPLIESSPHV